MKNKRSTVMIIDDDLANIQILNAILEDDYDILFAKDGPSALNLVKQAQPDVILLDVVMPEMDGYEVCRHLKTDSETHAIPVIFVTELNDIGAELKGLKVGAIDYITKPVSPPIVQMRVKNHIELKQARDSLALLAITDTLTGLANRRHFDTILMMECERLVRNHEPLSLLILDIDYFKRFNDQYGHVAGDECLKKVGQTIKSCLLRPADLAARYGGEEFACILPYTLKEGAIILAERIRTTVAAINFQNDATQDDIFVTVSLGVVTGLFKPDCSPTQIIELADKELYRAKKQGRNCVCHAQY